MIVWFMVFNATFNDISAISYRGGYLYWWMQLACLDKTIGLSQVTDKHYHKYQHL
jgi:hypothetical protein